jgi:DNA-binding CsgD family transcriptional regulator
MARTSHRSPPVARLLAAAIERDADALLLEEAWAASGLTAREQEVLVWVARGKTNGEIGETLWLSPGTVRKHLENAFAKLGVRTRTGAVARFLLLDGGDQPARPPQFS